MQPASKPSSIGGGAMDSTGVRGRPVPEAGLQMMWGAHELQYQAERQLAEALGARTRASARRHRRLHAPVAGGRRTWFLLDVHAI